MKKNLLFALSFILALSLSAQMPELPEILQEKMNEERLDLTFSYDETEMQNSEEEYYRYVSRTSGSDTLWGYKWKPDAQDWVLRARIIKAMNDAELPIEKKFQYITMAGEWMDGLHFSYSYNDSNQLTELVIQHWRPDSAMWINHFRKENIFNDGGNIASIQTSWWSKWNQEWVGHHKKTFTWSDGLLVADTVKINWFLTDGWVNHLYNEFAYNDSGLKVSKTLYFWWPFQESWKKTKKFNYSYNDSGDNITEVVAQKWFGDDAGWKNKHRYNFTFNDNGDITLYLFEYWNQSNSNWVEKIMIEYSYNDAGWMSQFVWQVKYFMDENWKNFKRVSFSYDDSGNMIERIGQRWNKMDEEWMNFRKWIIQLEFPTVTSIFDKEDATVEARFRNPYQSGDVISFSGLENDNYTLNLYDIGGKVVETVAINQSAQAKFHVSRHNGLYIMVLTDRNKQPVYNSKLVISN
jgi:hypothetical protein